MDLAECIRTARATRAYADRPVPDETVASVVELARRAGSGHNRQPWTFVAVRDRDRLDNLASFGDYTTPLRRAPVGVVIAVDEADSARRAEHNVLDCGRAVQNFVLAATDRGLGTVLQGFHDREGAGEFLELPDGKRVLVGVALGYPADEPATDIEGVPKEEELHHPGRRPVGELLHWETHS